jgi:hypothetical protein
LPDDRKYDFEAIPTIISPNKTGLLSKVPRKLHENCWDFLDFYRNAALIKYFTKNQYYVTNVIIQRINLDFQYVVLPTVCGRNQGSEKEKKGYSLRTGQVHPSGYTVAVGRRVVGTVKKG